MSNKEPMIKNEILRLGLILFLITAVAGGLLGIINDVTSPIIAEKQVEAANESRRVVLSSAEDFKQMEGQFKSDMYPDIPIDEVYEGLASSGTVGYVIKTLPKGYGGTVEVIVGVNKEGSIEAITIGNMSETPGLGAKSKEPAFQDQFKGKLLETLSVIKSGSPSNTDVLAISGATITSNAVTSGVNAAIDVFNTNLK